MSFQSRTNETVERIEIHLGTIDEDVLAGKKVGEVNTRFGIRSKGEGGIGMYLCVDKGHNWIENAIPGVTDGLPRPKWWRDWEEGMGFDSVSDV
jgi:hypothetical protein